MNLNRCTNFISGGGKLAGSQGHPDAKLNDLSKAVLYPDAPRAERAYLKSAEADFDFDYASSEAVADMIRTLQVSSGVEGESIPQSRRTFSKGLESGNISSWPLSMV